MGDTVPLVDIVRDPRKAPLAVPTKHVTPLVL